MESQTQIELGKLAAAAHGKRQKLLGEATFRRSQRRHLHVLAGIMALLSAGSTAAALNDLYPGRFLHPFSAVIAFLSGLLTLITSTYFDEKETSTMFEGAERFQSLRIDVDMIRMQPGITDSKSYKILVSKQNIYKQLSNSYDRFHAKPPPFSVSRIFGYRKPLSHHPSQENS